MKKSFLKLLAGQEFEISREFGIAQLNHYMLQQAMGAKRKDFIAQMEKSMQVGFFNKGVMIGNDPQNIKKGSVAHLTMSGVMMSNDGFCSRGMRSMDRQLREIYSNKNVEGILLEVESGGGQSTAGDILMNAIQDANKPIVVYTTLLASAAVKGTLPAAEIIAASSQTMVGSIGSVYIISKSILDESQDNDLEIYSTKSPNKNKEVRALRQGNFDPFIKRVTRNDELFMRQVQKFRPLKGTAEQIENTLSGEIFDSVIAKRRGLIDGTGSFNYALKRLDSHISYN